MYLSPAVPWNRQSNCVEVGQGGACAFTYVNNRGAAEETLSLARSVLQQHGCSITDGLKIFRYVEQAAEQAIADFGIFMLVNNAAIVRNNAAAMMSDREWDEVIATNLSGAFYAVRSFLMHFISNRNGRIISLSSLADQGCSGQINYSASKAGLVGLTRTLAKEYGPKGIRSNIVTAGYVRTDMTDAHMSESLLNAWQKFCPIKRACETDDIANAVHFLASDQAGFINGEELRVSGGLTDPF
jgi:3-oxoacyl-[acyl-carrier protein] reductase